MREADGLCGSVPPRMGFTNMRFGTVLLIIWLIFGAIAAGQRYHRSNFSPNCSKAGTVVTTILAGPLNYIGVDPKVDCKVRPSK